MVVKRHIQKEEISDLFFPNEEVLFTAEEQKQRKEKLHRALSLGNLERSKVQILFKDIYTTKVVETTIWGLTDRHVILKGGVIVPVKRIFSVKIL